MAVRMSRANRMRLLSNDIFSGSVNFLLGFPKILSQFSVQE
jgi:hypothetical protein